MTVRLDLSSEAESRLREQAAAAGKDLASFVLEAIEEKLAVADDASATNGREDLSRDQWIARFRRWAASHRALPYEADDSRDGIYVQPADVDRWLDEISEGLSPLPRLPKNLSRDDIYDEHD